VNLLGALGKRVMFVTNNSNKSRRDFLTELETKRKISFGFLTPEEKLEAVVCTSYTTARYCVAQGYKCPFVMTSDVGLLTEMKEAGITNYYATIDDAGKPRPEFEDPCMDVDVMDLVKQRRDVDCVVVGWDRGLSCRKLATALNFISVHEQINTGNPGFKPMPIITCSGDASGSLGTTKVGGVDVKIRPVGNGAMAQFLANCFDPVEEVHDMGKPSAELIGVLKHPKGYNVDLSKAMMVGDTLQTDMVFGNRGKMKTLLVMSGTTTERELMEVVQAKDMERIPTYKVPCLGSLLKVAPPTTSLPTVTDLNSTVPPPIVPTSN